MAISRKSTQNDKTEITTSSAPQATNQQTSTKNPSRKTVLVCSIVFLLVGAGGMYGYMNQSNQNMQNADVVEAKISKFGKIQDKQSKGSFTAYQLQTDGGSTVLYASNDGETLLLGDLYSSKDDHPHYFEEFLKKAGATGEKNPGAQSQSTKTTEIGVVLGEYTGDVPPPLEVLEKMGGFKENPNAAIADTIYLFYDPRCPYCHELFEKTRSLDQEGLGISLKWLPTTALGESEQALKMAAAGLQLQNKEELAMIFNKTHPGVDAVTDNQKTALQENLGALFFASDKIYGEGSTKAVPAAMFLNKKTGQLDLLYGVQNADVYRTIFGDN